MAGVRELDRGTLPTRYARGWHCLGLAEDFRDGEPHGIEVFGTKLVVWADGEGKINVLDGYCRHMGGDLTQGSVKDGNIACPFHDWRWGGDGKCQSIPYARRVPLRARTQRYETCEQNGQLFIWNDPEGNPPIPEQAIPAIPGMAEGEYSAWAWHTKLIEGANCREMIDNLTDMAHFFYIHFAVPTAFRNVFDGHTAAQIMESKARADVHDTDKFDIDAALLRSEAAYYGPAYMIDYLKNDFGNGFGVESALINCHYPISQNSFMLQWGVAVRRADGLDDVTAGKIATSMSSHFGEGFLQDVHIWQNKVPVQNPLLCEEDGPVYQNRRWYEQFYVDVADIQPDMVDRFEFEVDTTKAQEHWRAEIAENLAARETQDA
ncbi:3-ketosteroid-9-alpha-hydroxylase oxygenase subunit [Nocardioides szechwanensis]|uniref:Rieske-type oxygenase n=1 Tax=Nocardioides szechwanensis TaxID=1005944 RepID=A0A1H0IBR5_9ACTN|nr:Rieske 2Fe-2S domain-containing protein [Nocardioides szechwanensis]GEP34462.1 3-ketosteroid-9-alpha-hydroxylase oxygenase subunit [Nocardioides szechwanensis]SDO28899.1 3-ketosteroid 9alpha-monooxygenase subunit A [Nocardioides szechwanensis]